MRLAKIERITEKIYHAPGSYIYSREPYPEAVYTAVQKLERAFELLRSIRAGTASALELSEADAIIAQMDVVL